MGERWNDEELERLLARIELPGEDPALIQAFLDDEGFTDRVMESVAQSPARTRNALLWASFALLNLVVLAFLGTDANVANGYLARQPALSQFFYLFLGISCIGGVFGFVLSIDTGWFSRWTRRHI